MTEDSFPSLILYRKREKRKPWVISRGKLIFSIIQYQTGGCTPILPVAGLARVRARVGLWAGKRDQPRRSDSSRGRRLPSPWEKSVAAWLCRSVCISQSVPAPRQSGTVRTVPRGAVVAQHFSLATPAHQSCQRTVAPAVQGIPYFGIDRGKVRQFLFPEHSGPMMRALECFQ